MKSLSILLIDDEQSQLDSLKRFLTKRDHKVYTTTNGQEGITIVEENHIDLIISDFRMPVMNGLEVLNEVQKINPKIA